MSQQRLQKIANTFNEINVHSVAIGKIEENAQLTTADTGWSEEQKERMKAYGYDSLDMVRAWYS